MNPINSRESGLDPDRNRPYPHRVYPKPAEILGPVVSMEEFMGTFKTTVDTPVSALEGIDAVLAERGSRYGKFTGHAKITQDLKLVMKNTGNWGKLANDQKEALEMVAHKIGRILNGDPNYDDSWIDIGGYTKLVADRLTSGKEV